MINIDADIWVYTYKHKLGLCFYYENLTQDKILLESLSIDGIGVEVIGIDNVSPYKFELNPMESRFIQIKAKQINWSVKSLVSYTLESI